MNDKDYNETIEQPCPECENNTLMQLNIQKELIDTGPEEIKRVQSIRPYDVEEIRWVVCSVCETLLWANDSPQYTVDPTEFEDE